MRHLSVSLMTLAAVATILIGACSQAIAAQPTSPPSAKVDFPAKGRAITVIVPYAAGGGTDVTTRLMARLMEKELGVPVQVVNRPGGGAQIGLTELARAKPDGYTIGATLIPTVVTTYLDPERKAIYSRKDFQPLAIQYEAPFAVVVPTSSPYKTLKDLVDAAKASPGTIKMASTGLIGSGHLAILQFEEAAAIRFAVVHFDGGAPAMTALLGGHVNASVNAVSSEILPHIKTGAIRILGVLGPEESRFLPGVKTAESQGYKAYMSVVGALSAPAGIPREVTSILSAAAKKAIESDEHKKMMADSGFEARYRGPEEFATLWAESEVQLKPLVELAKRQ